MLRVGLSGGIGSGKSTVARRLEELGAIIVDADVVAREVVKPGSEGLAELVAHFGSDILNAEGALNRSSMARRVFHDEEARNRLNSIVHPRIASRTAELITQAPRDAIVVHDIPLLVEAGYAPHYHLVIIVDAPVEDRVHRLVGRGLDESDARSRIRAQASDQQRREAADAWLDNRGAVEEVLAEVDRLWSGRLARFEQNVRSSRPAERGASRLVESDPDWPVQAQRLISRLKQAAGEWALRVDHTGSTSVPGLPATDVLDLQVTVRSWEEAEALTAPLGAAGFPLVSETAGDGAFASSVEEQEAPGGRERYHASADPDRPADVHIRIAGSAAWRDALLLPAWLRADMHTRHECEAFKRRLAEQHPSEAEGSAQAERRWFTDNLPRALEWARQAGWYPPAV